MTLLDRTAMHSESFRLVGSRPIYARTGYGPNSPGNYRVPQRTSCLVRRLIKRMYVLQRFQPDGELVWPVRAPERVVVVDLQGERLCVRMNNLVFFEEGVRLSTIVNLQVPWVAFESPLITCVAGVGRIGLRIDGDADRIAHDGVGAAPKVNFLRLAAWAGDTRFGVSVGPGYSNTILVAHASAVVQSSSLVVAGRSDSESVETAGLLHRVGRLVMP